MKVLVFSNVSSGLYKFRKELLQALISQQHTVTIVAPEDQYTPGFHQLGCAYIPIQIDRRSTNPIQDFALLLRYIQLIRKYHPDLVLTYTVKPNIYGGLACRLTKTPYLANITGFGTAIENGGLLSNLVLALYKMGLKGAQCVFFQNSQNQQSFIERSVITGFHRLIPGSGVNLNDHCFEPYPSATSNIRFLFAGRIMRNKGIHELLEAAKSIHKHHPQVQFDLIGSFDEDYKAVLEQAEAQGYLHFWGRQNDVHSWYAQSWAVIMPSYHEGMSNVCLEAASTGRPVLASDIPGCRETFDEGVTGFGFPAKNGQALADAIERFLNLPYDEKVQMGLAGRQKMEQEFDRQLVISAYMDEINKIAR